jgi:hypothetical protein
MASFKTGLSLLWHACWTGIPVKMALALLFMMMGLMHLETKAGLALLLLFASPVTTLGLPFAQAALDLHLSEGAGLGLLFLLAIPIDIWALGVTGKTLLLEKLRVEPTDGLGLALWGRIAVFGLVFFPLLCIVLAGVPVLKDSVESAPEIIATVVTGGTVGIAKAVTHAILEIGPLKQLPVAERISAEFTLWGSVAGAVLLALLVIGCSVVGWMVQRVANSARPAGAGYQELVTRWDLMRVPADQPLMLVAFSVAGTLLVFLMWATIPVTTPHPHESYKKDEKKVGHAIKPAEALQKADRVLTQAEASVQVLEEQAKKTKKTKAPEKKPAAGKSKA